MFRESVPAPVFLSAERHWLDWLSEGEIARNRAGQGWESPSSQQQEENSCSVVFVFVTLWPVACQASSVRVISPARMLEPVAISFSRGSSRQRDRTRVFCVGKWLPLSQLGGPSYALEEYNSDGVWKESLFLGDRPLLLREKDLETNSLAISLTWNLF